MTFTMDVFVYKKYQTEMYLPLLLTAAGIP